MLLRDMSTYTSTWSVLSMHGPCRPVCRACPRDDRPGRDHHAPCIVGRGVVHGRTNLMRLAIIRAERQQATDACMDGWEMRFLFPACATASAISPSASHGLTTGTWAVGIRLPSLCIHADAAGPRERRYSWDTYSAC